MKKIFIACPITKYIEENRFTDERLKLFTERLYCLCREYADEVFMALKREQYGKKLMLDSYTVLDYKEMEMADIVIAIPEDSKGTAVELGWASVMKKSIILLLDRGYRYTPLISGLGDITDTTIIWYDEFLNDEVLTQVSIALKQLKKKET